MQTLIHRTFCAFLALAWIVSATAAQTTEEEELASVYGGADAFVLPSLSEPWGLVVNEAMLCGLPVLVSTQCGCATDLAQPETGWQPYAPGRA